MIALSTDPTARATAPSRLYMVWRLAVTTENQRSVRALLPTSLAPAVGVRAIVSIYRHQRLDAAMTVTLVVHGRAHAGQARGGAPMWGTWDEAAMALVRGDGVRFGVDGEALAAP